MCAACQNPYRSAVYRQRPTRPSAANRTPAMAHSCRYATGGARWEPQAVARGPGREPQSRPRAATDAMLRPYHDPRPRLRRGTPQEPGAPAAPYTWQTRVGLAGLGAPKAPPYAAGGRPRAARTAPKAPSGCVDRACHGPASRRATPPLERQRFWGYVGRVAHRWAMRKRCCGPSKSYERPGKKGVSTRNRKSPP